MLETIGYDQGFIKVVKVTGIVRGTCALDLETVIEEVCTHSTNMLAFSLLVITILIQPLQGPFGDDPRGSGGYGVGGVGVGGSYGGPNYGGGRGGY